jgi:hypothetical protein
LAAISISKLTLNDALTVGLSRMAEAAAAGIGSVSDAAILVALADAAMVLSWLTVLGTSPDVTLAAHEAAPAADALPAAHAVQLAEVWELEAW